MNHQNQQQHSNNNVHLVGDYRKESVVKILKSRIGWLSAFFLGLILAAVVVERFEELLTHEVELSYFVPLLIGHGGNTGSQSVATVIRAIALKQIKPENTREVLQVLFKEAVSGFIMGGFLGVLTPLFYRYMDMDPASNAGPLDTAVQDVLGNSLFLATAGWLLNVFGY